MHDGVREFVRNYRMVKGRIRLAQTILERLPMVHVDIQSGIVSLAVVVEVGRGIGGDVAPFVVKGNG